MKKYTVEVEYRDGSDVYCQSFNKISEAAQVFDEEKEKLQTLSVRFYIDGDVVETWFSPKQGFILNYEQDRLNCSEEFNAEEEVEAVNEFHEVILYDAVTSATLTDRSDDSVIAEYRFERKG